MHGRRPPTAVDPEKTVTAVSETRPAHPVVPVRPQRPQPRAGGAAGEGPHAHRGDRRAEPGALARGDGRRHRLRHPRWRDPARLRPAAGLGQGPAHPGPPRAGRRPRRRGLRVRDRPGRRLHGDLAAPAPRTSSRRWPTPTWTRCRSSRSPVRSLGAHRHRRLPGGRHPRHHDADHQAQLPRDQRRRHPARRSPRRSTSPPPAAPARCSSTSPRTPCRRATDVLLAADASTCPATARSPARTASRCARPPG